MIRPLLLAVALAACTTPETTRPDATPLACASATVIARYRVDATTVPLTNDAARNDGFDVIGDDGVVDNQLGQVFAAVNGQLEPDFQPDVGAAAAFAGGVDWEIETETCPDTGETRVRVGSVAGSTPRADGQRFGTTVDATGGCAEVPVAAITGGADAGWVLANELDAKLAVGDGEISGVVGFALEQPRTSAAFASAMAPFLTREEALAAYHDDLAGWFDADHDGVITAAELQASSLYQSLLAPDSPNPPPAPTREPVCPPGVGEWISFGVAVHAVAE